ncbi:prepilin-type N-terminal cleavage/methylation domain-containing protein [Sulfuricurvum sp.]|uniref:type II secretion system protein n=1 Tax=Sulfuricurvum sp. TaxID=2025608 RepID=UPI002610A49F|nr:prepilin-type N-terminal cleavage/methylation domain-containing protein [Sulfuricurvum sp.]MDD2782016.1 prepilin-type N-terminal cleavage/methylation domain-containing protein [Sulfuricurvum sp.]
MKRHGYTLIEIIITVAITGILSVGMFKAFEAITLRSEKAKILTTLSIDSQSALDQISILLYNRAPMSVSGYNLGDATRTPLATATDKKIIEWLGLASESYVAGDYSGFVDMNRSDYATATLYTPQTTKASIETTQANKWGSFNWANNEIALVFSGTFDEGVSTVHPITMNVDNSIVFSGAAPTTIYEKYNLIDSAYTVARGADIDQSANCITTLGISSTAIDNTLFLFYDYRPWNGESFCADSTNRSGVVSILATNVNAFRAQMINGTIRLAIDTNRTVRGGNPVRLSKQKVVF